jgi:hypothetical protein
VKFSTIKGFFWTFNSSILANFSLWFWRISQFLYALKVFMRLRRDQADLALHIKIIKPVSAKCWRIYPTIQVRSEIQGRWNERRQVTIFVMHFDCAKGTKITSKSKQRNDREDFTHTFHSLLDILSQLIFSL